jgi:uncharacterized membrane-anchored protein
MTLSIHRIHTVRRELFYWAEVTETSLSPPLAMI